MKANVFFAIVLATASVASVNAQNAVQPQPQQVVGVTQQEFTVTIQGLKSRADRQDHKIRRTDKEVNVLHRAQAKQAQRAAGQAGQIAMQGNAIENTTLRVDGLNMSVSKLEKQSSGQTIWLRVLSIVLFVSLVIGIIVALRLRKKQDTVKLSPNANPTEVKAYAEAKGKINKTIPYVIRLEKLDPINPSEKIVYGIVEGKVHHAGTAEEYYEFGKNVASAKNRFNAAIRAFEAHEAKRISVPKNA